jgi:coenzyme F420 biosynthesis associated uncharacterized protein
MSRPAGDQPDPGPPGDPAAAPEMVDWQLAATTARRLSGSGPQVTVAEAREVVADLHEFAARSVAHVHGYTRLDASASTAPVLVVDRGGWAQANVDGMRQITAPVVERLRKARGGSAGGGLFDQIGPKITGLETGALLAFLSGKVLGQYDPYHEGEGVSGRLLLVAPNVVQVERELDVDPRDFRMWVCLHEETHRTQFTAVPWLRDHLQGEFAAFLDATDLDPGALLGKVVDLVRGVLEALVASEGSSGPSLAELLQNPQQKAIVDRITALMSLLEGHADVVMDEVGPAVVPSVARIRERFQRRRAGGGGLDRAVRRLLGLEAKVRQYRDGAVFVRRALNDVGMTGFNQVWTSPETLPTPEELADPVAWIRRVPGLPALGTGG